MLQIDGVRRTLAEMGEQLQSIRIGLRPAEIYASSL